MKKVRLSLCGLAGVLFLNACAQEEIGEAQYSAEQCRRVKVVDAATGDKVRGAEDFALDAPRGRLYFSAYDRRSVEKAARKGEMTIPNGGVYAVAVSELFDPDLKKLKTRSLAAPGDIAGGLRPHGITFDERNQEVVFINRTYQRINRRWKMTPRLQCIGANGEVFVGAENDAACGANDVLVTDQHVFTTFDHGGCGWRAGIEDIFNLKRSGIALANDGKVFDRAGFANGLAQAHDGHIVMAATRDKELFFLKERASGVEESLRIKTPGGPDNLSTAYDGGIVAAAHPSLFKLALNRKLGLGKAPSRIVKADLKSGETAILFDDPKGALFSAATVAVQTREGLVAGSATDEGLLVCQAKT